MKKAHPELKNQFSKLQQSMNIRMSRLAKEKGPKENEQKKLGFLGVPDALELTAQETDDQVSKCNEYNCLYAAGNHSLQSKLRELKDETGRLRKYVAEKEYEVQKLTNRTKRLQDERILLAGPDSAATAPTKIVELSKKNREIMAQVEIEKSKCMRLQQKIIELENMVHRLKNPPTKLSPSKEKEESASEQLQVVNMKLIDCRNQMQSLKQELKIAHKVICQEIGEENVNLANLLKDSQGFRGRSFQIKALQAKVRDLERKLKGNAENELKDKNINRIKQQEKNRKQSIDVIKQELNKTQESLSDTNKKLEGTKSRNKVLSQEIKSLKSQIQMLQDKGSHDNELIDTLMTQQEKLQVIMQNVAQQNSKSSMNEQETSKKMHMQDQKAFNEIQQLKTLLEEKEEKIREYEESQNKSMTSSVNIRDSIEVASDRLTSARKEKPKEYRSIGTNTTRKLERPNCETIKPKTEELEYRCEQLSAMLKSVQNERDSLLKVNSNLSQREQSLSEQLCRLTSYRQQHHQKGDSLNKNAKLAEIENQLVLQIDENNALKETLNSVQQSHQQDVSLYNAMLDETKQVFLDTINNLVAKK